MPGHHRQVSMAETLEFNDVYQEVKGSMVRRAWAWYREREGGRVKYLAMNKSLL